MEDVETSKQAIFCNIFHTAAQDIAKGISASLAVTIDEQQTTWAFFC